MLDLLFPVTRSRVLSLLLLAPEQGWHPREIARRTGLTPLSVQRELARLGKLGLVRGEREGRRKHFLVDSGHLLYPELRGLVVKTSGPPEQLRDALSRVEGVAAAALFGPQASSAGEGTGAIDLLVVCAGEEIDLQGALAPVEARLGRPVNFILMSTSELSRRREKREPYVERLLGGPLLPLIGDLHAL